MKIFITGSSDGLGKLAANKMLKEGHQVVVHARNEKRKKEIQSQFPAETIILVGDLSNIIETIKLADDVNKLGYFDAVIHNAGIYQSEKKAILNVNCIAPYILTCLIQKPGRLIYLSSGLHTGGSTNLKNFSDGVSYSTSKLFIVMLSNAVARKWPEVYSNAVNPGWVPTKMGGRGAPDDLQKGFETQVWLATSEDTKAKVSGKYFFHKQIVNHNHDADDAHLQDKFLRECERISGIVLPF